MGWSGQEGSAWIGRGGDPSAVATSLGMLLEGAREAGRERELDVGEREGRTEENKGR